MEVPRSVYYYHLKHTINSYHEANKLLDGNILLVYEESKERYGSTKITKALNDMDIKVSQKRVLRRMRALGIHSITVKKFKATSLNKDNSNDEYKNLLDQNFKASEPGYKWVGDITYIYTNELGWTYLATVMDLFDLKIIGWEYASSMTDDLTIKTLEKACKARKPKLGLIFHSDRRSQYTSNKYESKLKEYGITHSYSRKGYPYDNACMESFNSILKKEMVNHIKYKTFNEAKISLFEFIEGWYHNKRIHGSLNYMTPNQKYQSYLINLQ